jgi:hypothetical protein
MVLGVLGIARHGVDPPVLARARVDLCRLLDCFVVTAVFFGHTSHRSYQDVYWIGYAAHVVWPPDWVRLDPDGLYFRRWEAVS